MPPFDPATADLKSGLWRGSLSTMGVPATREQLQWMEKAINEGNEESQQELFKLYHQRDGELFIVPVGYPHFVVNAERHRSLKIAFDYVNAEEPENLVYHAVVQRQFTSKLMGPSQAEDYSGNDSHIVERLQAWFYRQGMLALQTAFSGRPQ